MTSAMTPALTAAMTPIELRTLIDRYRAEGLVPPGPLVCSGGRAPDGSFNPFGTVADLVVLGANLFKDLFAGLRDLVGGRSATYERELQNARELALEEMQQKARAAGANAVIGVDLDYEVLGQANGMLMVSASGTAVVITPNS
mgnify:CR=1 FL=1